MQNDLLPMSVGDIFDEAFDLYKRRFALFAGIVAMVHVPSQIALSALFLGMKMNDITGGEDSSANVYRVMGMLTIGCAMGAIYLFLFVLQNAALTVAVSETYLGREVTITGAYRRMLTKFWKILSAWLVLAMFFSLVAMTLMTFLSMILGMVIVAMSAGGSSSDTVGTVMAGGMLVILTISLMVVLAGGGAFITPIIIVEGVPAMQAVTRNRMLMKGRFMKILGTILLLLVITGALLITLYISADTAMELLVFSWMKTSSMLKTTTGEIIFALIWMFLQPFLMVCLTLLYYDQRVRKEGLDLAFLEQQMGSNVSGGRRA